MDKSIFILIGIIILLFFANSYYSKRQFSSVLGKSSQAEPIPAATQGDTQVLNTIYTLNNDIQPNTFSVVSGKPVKMQIDVKEDGNGCMSSITIPGLAGKVEILTKGKSITFDFTPKSKGEYPITCAMGIPRGKIIVN